MAERIQLDIVARVNTTNPTNRDVVIPKGYVLATLFVRDEEDANFIKSRLGWNHFEVVRTPKDRGAHPEKRSKSASAAVVKNAETQRIAKANAEAAEVLARHLAIDVADALLLVEAGAASLEALAAFGADEAALVMLHKNVPDLSDRLSDLIATAHSILSEEAKAMEAEANKQAEEEVKKLANEDENGEPSDQEAADDSDEKPAENTDLDDPIVNLSRIEGIGPVTAKELIEHGIKNVHMLTVIAGTPGGREELLTLNNISESELDRFVASAQILAEADTENAGE